MIFTPTSAFPESLSVTVPVRTDKSWQKMKLNDRNNTPNILNFISPLKLKKRYKAYVRIMFE